MIRLFVQTYDAKNAPRQAELQKCLDGNRLQVEMVTIERQERITFREWFDIINQTVGDDDVSILANSDILFNETVKKAESIRENECYALSRWDNGKHLLSGADAWVFRGKIRQIENCEFGLGVAHCDYAIADRLTRAGYVLRNPCTDIVTDHVHQSNLRTYYGMKRVDGPYIEEIPVTRIFAHQAILPVWCAVSPSHEGLLSDFLAPSIPQGTPFNVRRMEQKCQTGVFNTAGWKEQTAEKIKVMQEMAKGDGYFVFLDADVKIRHPMALEVMLSELGENDIAFQKDDKAGCTGVFVGRCNERTRALFDMAIASFPRSSDDQNAINECLPKVGVKWCFLSKKFWNYSHYILQVWDGKSNIPIPKEALLVHANWCMGLEKKRAILGKA